MGTAQLHKRRSVWLLWFNGGQGKNLAATRKERFFLFWIGIEVQVLSVIVKVTTSRACVRPKIKWIIATAIIRIIKKNIWLSFYNNQRCIVFQPKFVELSKLWQELSHLLVSLFIHTSSLVNFCFYHTGTEMFIKNHLKLEHGGHMIQTFNCCWWMISKIV